MESDVLLKKTQEAMDEWFRRAIVAEEKMLGFRKALEQRDKDNAELHERLNRENESANKHFVDSKKKGVEIAELQAALDELKTRLNDENERANKAVKELKDKSCDRDFWFELSEKKTMTINELQKKYDNAIEIGLGYMNQCEKAQSEVEGLKSTVKRMGERITTLSDDLHLALHRLEYSNDLVEKMSKEKQYLLDQLTVDEKKIAGLQETVGRYAAECSKLNAELAAKRQAVPSPWIFTCNSFTA